MDSSHNKFQVDTRRAAFTMRLLRHWSRGQERWCDLPRMRDLFWTRLQATWSEKLALLWEGVWTRSPVEVSSSLDQILWSRVIKCVFIGESSILYRNALQQKTWPFGMKLYFYFLLAVCLPPAAKSDYTLMRCTFPSVFNYSRLLPDISVPT